MDLQALDVCLFTVFEAKIMGAFMQTVLNAWTAAEEIAGKNKLKGLKAMIMLLEFESYQSELAIANATRLADSSGIEELKIKLALHLKQTDVLAARLGGVSSLRVRLEVLKCFLKNKPDESKTINRLADIEPVQDSILYW